MQQQQQSPPRPSWFVVQVTAIASLGGILFGYDLGVIAGALPQLIHMFQLSSKSAEIIVSVLYLGGGLGATLGGSICDMFGRKRAILCTDVIFAVGAIVLMSAPNVITLILGRIIVGFGVAVSGIADVSYLHEIAPVEFRGAIVSVNEACISLGFLLAFGVGTALTGNPNGWRTMFGLSGVLALCQFVGMLQLPESPQWLEKAGRHEESEAALRRIHSEYVRYEPSTSDHHHPPQLPTTTTTTMNESSVLYQSTLSAPSTTLDKTPMSSSPSTSVDLGTRASLATSIDTDEDDDGDDNDDILSNTVFERWGILSRVLAYLYGIIRQLQFLFQQLRTFGTTIVQEYRIQAWIAIFLAVTQQFCGQTSVLMYAPMILTQAAAANNNPDGENEDNQQDVSYSTLYIGLVKFVVTVLVIWKIDTVGRRCLLLSGIATIGVGLLLLTIAFRTVPPDASADAPAPLQKSFLALPGVLLVVSGYSISYGPLTWLLTSELFPTDIRGRALGASTILTYICGYLVTYTFLSAQTRVGTSAVFLFYAIITGGSVMFAYLAIPDTGGKDAGEIERDLHAMRWWNVYERSRSETQLLRRESSGGIRLSDTAAIT
jgi:MFS family permease